MKNFLIILLAIYCFASLASAQEAEKILGYSATKTGLTFQVTSGGCTKAEDFTTNVNHSHITEITLIRMRADTCYAFIPTGVKIKIPYEKLGIQPGQAFILKNTNGVVQGWIWKDSDD